MKKMCLLLIVVLLCLSGCDTYRYRNTYRVEFTQGKLIEKSVLENFEQIKSCSVTRTGHYGRLGGSFDCDIYLDSPDNVAIAENVVEHIYAIFKENREVYEYFLDNCRNFTVCFRTSEEEPLSEFYTFNYWNFEKWFCDPDNGKSLLLPLTDHESGKVLINGKSEYSVDVQRNQYTAGFVLPVKKLFDALNINYAQEEQLLYIFGSGINLEIKLDEEGAYKQYKEKSELHATNYYDDSLLRNNPYLNSSDNNEGLYPYVIWQSENDELYIDNTTFIYLLDLIQYDDLVTVVPDYSLQILKINAVE